ncbi:hypothetical protein BDY24DRAFT_105299 [Mrakia frigida]|uniref:uncharacterized protein n=1 Tax=Mrakia frigida TaxID=29902 RepID=UPI003FCC0913
MDSAALFSGRTAWFSSSCPRAHVESWVNNGGSRFSSVETAGKLRGGVDFVFLRDLEDLVYARLSSSAPILLSSLWVQISVEKNRRCRVDSHVSLP